MPEFNYRLVVKAGLTGYAQIYGKYNTEAIDKLKMDLYYINKMSFLYDVQLCFMTVKTLFMKDSTEAFKDVSIIVKKQKKQKNINKLISIVMPTYNSDKYIKESIDSILNQTYSNWELIIIDDSSTDNTSKILSNYRDKRIKVYKNETNKGVAYSRNKGISLCTSDVIAFLDSDDIWAKDKLEKQIYLYSRERQFIFTGSYFIDEIGKQNSYQLKVPEKINRNELLKRNIISCSSVMINKKYLLNHPFPEVKNIHEDFVTWLQILNDIDYAYGINDPLLTYRLRKSSKSFNKLHAAFMNLKVYRYIKLPLGDTIKNMFFYMIKNIKKYAYIKIDIDD